MFLRAGNIEIEITRAWVHLKSTIHGFYWSWRKGHRVLICIWIYTILRPARTPIIFTLTLGAKGDSAVSFVIA